MLSSSSRDGQLGPSPLRQLTFAAWTITFVYARDEIVYEVGAVMIDVMSLLLLLRAELWARTLSCWLERGRRGAGSVSDWVTRPKTSETPENLRTAPSPPTHSPPLTLPFLNSTLQSCLPRSTSVSTRSSFERCSFFAGWAGDAPVDARWEARGEKVERSTTAALFGPPPVPSRAPGSSLLARPGGGSRVVVPRSERAAETLVLTVSCCLSFFSTRHLSSSFLDVPSPSPCPPPPIHSPPARLSIVWLPFYRKLVVEHHR